MISTIKVVLISRSRSIDGYDINPELFVTDRIESIDKFLTPGVHVLSQKDSIKLFVETNCEPQDCRHIFRFSVKQGDTLLGIVIMIAQAVDIADSLLDQIPNDLLLTRSLCHPCIIFLPGDVVEDIVDLPNQIFVVVLGLAIQQIVRFQKSELD